MQLDHYSSKFNPKKFPVTLVCCDVSNAPNIGSLLRVADAFGITKVYFCGTDIPIGRRMKKTSRSTENSVDFEKESSADELIEQLKAHNFMLIALEITSNSIKLNSVKVNSKRPIALIIGGENHGIAEKILNKCDLTTHIEMYGNNSSMNVSHATAIALHHLIEQLH